MSTRLPIETQVQVVAVVVAAAAAVVVVAVVVVAVVVVAAVVVVVVAVVDPHHPYSGLVRLTWFHYPVVVKVLLVVFKH